MKPPQKILLIRTDRIGDVVLSLPMAELVKKKFPQCKVSYFIRDYPSALLDNNPFIDEVLIVEESDGKILFSENLQKIKSKKFDTCVVINPTLRIALLIFLAGIRYRIGTGYRWYSFLFNKKVYEHRKYGDKHELEYNINLLAQIGIGSSNSENIIKFNLSADEKSLQKIESLIIEKGHKPGSKIVVIHPGSGGSSVDLPKEKLIQLTKLISTIDSVTIVITGSKNEFDLCMEFEVSDSVINLAGQLDLNLLKALIKKSNLFISNSTGPMHIAAAFGVYVIGFFPKILSCSQNRWGPYTDKRTIYVPTIDCSNCTREQCEKLDCMNSIDIGRVFDETMRVLKIQ